MVRSDGGRAAPRGWCALLLSFYGLTLLQPFRTTPAVARGHGFPSLSKEGRLLCRATETSLVEMGLVLLPVLLYDGFFLIRTSPKTELVANYGNPGGFISVNKR